MLECQAAAAALKTGWTTGIPGDVCGWRVRLFYEPSTTWYTTTDERFPYSPGCRRGLRLCRAPGCERWQTSTHPEATGGEEQCGWIICYTNHTGEHLQGICRQRFKPATSTTPVRQWFKDSSYKTEWLDWASTCTDGMVQSAKYIMTALMELGLSKFPLCWECISKFSTGADIVMGRTGYESCKRAILLREHLESC